MRNMKFYREGEDLFALKDFLFDGDNVVKGDSFDVDKLSKLQLERFFGLWLIGHEDDLEKRSTRLEGLFSEPLERGEDTSELQEEESSDDSKVEIVEDTETVFKVRYKGIEKEIKRNQLREDGTLTKGALKLFN